MLPRKPISRHKKKKKKWDEVCTKEEKNIHKVEG
jgi:hypothetical protein